MNDKIYKAEQERESSTKRLMEVIKDEYPIDSVVGVRLGNAECTIRITGHSEYWWSSPCDIRGVNTETHKARRFSVNAIIT